MNSFTWPDNRLSYHFICLSMVVTLSSQISDERIIYVLSDLSDEENQ